ncbi:L-dopachrome tautomerase yellow-f-like [Battus philenor]|uniref:L-dopachrome tautomerase yellow-f-like n=1 Tax=Battus philenor TaxID=42288 RepID=UPI0035D04B10
MIWHFVLLPLLALFQLSGCLLPPKFQWKVLDFAWEGQQREAAIASHAYIPENNMPTGLARWKDKLFITVPRWKRGVPSSLNYVYVNGSQQQNLNPYPSWGDAFIADDACCASTNSTVVSAFRIHIDKCDRLWVVDNGATDMSENVKQLVQPAILVFDLKQNTLQFKHVFEDQVLRDSSVFTSIAVDIMDNDCRNTYAYISDMGSGAIVVYDLKHDAVWRLESPLFQHEENSSQYKVGGIDFFWNDGVSSVALSSPKKSDGHRDLYCHPTSSTKILRISTKLLRKPYATQDEIYTGIHVEGDKGPLSQATACDYHADTNVLFFTLLSKNGVGCWNLEREFSLENLPLLVSDCNVLEFPNDIKVDFEGNVWILSDRQSRFLYNKMDFNETNFRVLSAKASELIRGSRCQLSFLEKAWMKMI